jgi:hypothetical protein
MASTENIELAIQLHDVFMRKWKSIEDHVGSEMVIAFAPLLIILRIIKVTRFSKMILKHMSEEDILDHIKLMTKFINALDEYYPSKGG